MQTKEEFVLDKINKFAMDYLERNEAIRPSKLILLISKWSNEYESNNPYQ